MKTFVRSLSATIGLALSALSVQGQFTYQVINGALTITGYAGPGGAVVIPGAVNGVPVVSIGEEAFAHAGLTSVTIPGSVITIGGWAFEFCYSLTNATIGDGVVSVGEAAFWSCSNLTSVIIPSGVTSIGNGAFAFCSKLTNITIPNSVTDIAESAFSTCTRLTSAVIPSSVTSIEDQTFQDCAGLTNVTIPNSVANIGVEAFVNCTSLTSVAIPDSVINIRKEAFAGCSNLTRITIGQGVASIGDFGMFQNCPSLKSVYFRGNAPIVDSSVFSGDNDVTFYYLPGTTGWGPFFDNRPAVLWNPQVKPGSFGVRTNQIAFSIAGNSGLVVVVEVSTNLANSAWYPLQTNTLSGGSLYFTDPKWTNYPARFYRLRWP